MRVRLQQDETLWRKVMLLDEGLLPHFALLGRGQQ
jgi:hypothetical protein